MAFAGLSRCPPVPSAGGAQRRGATAPTLDRPDAVAELAARRQLLAWNPGGNRHQWHQVPALRVRLSGCCLPNERAAPPRSRRSLVHQHAGTVPTDSRVSCEVVLGARLQSISGN